MKDKKFIKKALELVGDIKRTKETESWFLYKSYLTQLEVHLKDGLKDKEFPVFYVMVAGLVIYAVFVACLYIFK